MRKFVLVVALLFVMDAFTGIGIAHGKDRMTDAQASFKKDYPAVTLENIEKTDIDGIYEVYAGGNIIYYNPGSGNVIFGEMITKGYKNVTVERRNSLTSLSLKSVPLDKAIVIGHGKNKVIEVVDVDCPFCRKVDDFLDKRDDVTRYVFLFPLEQLHPASMKKSTAILCSSDRVGAYREAMKGQYDGKDIAVCNNDAATKLLFEYKAIAEKLGVKGTPALWINNTPVSGANIPQIEQLLSAGGGPLISSGKEVKNHEKN